MQNFGRGKQGALWEVGNRTSLVCDLQRYKIREREIKLNTGFERKCILILKMYSDTSSFFSVHIVKRTKHAWTLIWSRTL